ncbi:MAG: nucleotidyltransferase domain-containing protein [Polyangiaceae bacterium]|nr:nucleotidyltransferase domain-containing protein [Polyangiaceae bacterium]
MLRIEPGLHAVLRRAARDAGLSLNELCARRLAAPAGALEAGPAPSLVQRAAAVHGDDLVGVVVFGSWARGEATIESDVDVLVVLDERRPLVRALYRRWDADPLTWEGRSIEPHLVHLPGEGTVGTIWAEAAVDGIVLFERNLRVSRELARVRRAIVAGRLVRRTLHGQPYWAEVA